MRQYREVPSGPEIKEGEKVPETKVVLHFLRHEEKGKAEPEQSDFAVELTPKGREKAIQKGKEKPAQLGVSWAAGSPRIRSAHTALLRMMAGEEILTPEMGFEEAKAEVEKWLKEKGVKYGKKLAILPELGFYIEAEPEYKQKTIEAFDAGRGLEFVLRESDDLARRFKNLNILSHSQVAANFASLIAREMQVGNNFNQIVARDPEKYKKYGNQIERYFGSHQGTLECFYAKVLEKLYGPEKVDELIDKFRDKDGKANGFDFQEGFKVEIKNGLEGQKVILEGVRGFPDIELTPELLRDIIGDAIKLDEEIEGTK